DNEETASDNEMLDDCPQAVDTAQDHRLADQERKMGASTMEIAARDLVAKGYVVFTASTQWDAKAKRGKGGKKMIPPRDWPASTLADCLTDRFFQPYNNTLLINTAASGVVVLDFDVGDGGMEQLALWETEHGAFDAPRVRTGSGGVHIYFSHRRSLASGLGVETPTHFAKLELRVRDPTSGKEVLKKVGVDMRGVSSNGMIACPPSSYERLGETARYTVDGGGELPLAEDLPPLPKWLIEILNERASRGSGERSEGPSEVLSGAGPSARASAGFEAPDLTDRGLQQEVVEVMRGMLSSFGDNSSVFSKAEPSTVAGLGAVMYHWRNDGGGRMCPYAEEGACSRTAATILGS
ncbi:hypothetical protein KFL_008050010, partial [Klebsormidium nitens]